jgi:hypothetical protein
MKRNFVVLLSLFLAKVLFSQDFEVSPILLFFNAEPGESQTKFLNIKNHSSQPETFILSISDYSIDNKGKGTYVDAGSLKQSIADWTSIAPSFFELQPNGEQQIAVTMQQAADDFGSKWGVIFVRTAKEQTTYSADKTLAAGMTMSARIAVDVYQTPGSNKEYKATIGNLTEIGLQEDSTRTFSAVVNNLSDIITNCKVYMIATNVQTSEEFMFGEEKFVMFPKSSRKMELFLSVKLPKGTYSLAAILDYGSKTNLEGAQTIIKVE